MQSSSGLGSPCANHLSPLVGQPRMTCSDIVDAAVMALEAAPTVSHAHRSEAGPLSLLRQRQPACSQSERQEHSTRRLDAAYRSPI